METITYSGDRPREKFTSEQFVGHGVNSVNGLAVRGELDVFASPAKDFHSTAMGPVGNPKRIAAVDRLDIAAGAPSDQIEVPALKLSRFRFNLQLY